MFMKKILQNYLVLFILITSVSHLVAQDCVGASQWPSSSITVASNGDITTITTCNYANEYSVLTGIGNGEDYEFTSGIAGDYFTLRDGSNTGSTILAQGTTPLSWTANSDDDVYLHIHADNSCTDDGSICRETTAQCTSCAPPPAPANDECANATSIDDTDVLTGNTDAATTANAQTACNGGGGGGDCDAGGTGTTDFSEGVWFVYTSSSSGESITVATDNVGTDFDTEIQVFEGSCGSLTCVGGDDDGGDGTGHNFDSKFCWVSTANFAPVNYYIYIDGHSGATGNYAVSLDVVQAPLPVELTSFQGEVTEKSNRLIWETASEENTEMHIIERSIDGQDNWEVVGEVPAAGNSFVAQNYKLEDMNPVAEAYYRLKSVDFDGYTEFSEVIMLERKIEEFEVVNIAPNPASASVNLTVQTPKSGFYTIRLTNTVGQIVYLEQSNMDSGIHSKEINISDLSNGIYFITIENGLESLVHRIVKQ